MRFLANLVYLLGAVFYAPVLLFQMIVQRKNRRGWRERFGHWAIRPGGRRIWIHAVSLGEINATPALVRKLQERLPGAEFVLSTTTDTGYARACSLYGRERVFRFPLDFSWVVRRVLARVQPSLIVLMELEVWYNLVQSAGRRGVPVIVVNGRLTERSRRRFGWIAPAARSMFRCLTWVGAQDETIARRFVELGVPADRVEVTGSMKWDTTTLADRVDGADRLAAALGINPDVPLWVCGSTGPGEVEILLDAWAALLRSNPPLQLAIIPRKPERFNEVADLVQRRGFPCLRRSECPDAPEPRAPALDVPTESGGPGSARADVPLALDRAGEKASLHPVSGATDVSPVPSRADESVILGDTMGELRKFYSLAQVVFVGRSLVPMGGSDPMEVAALGKPLLVGPHMENFAAAVAELSAAGVVQVVRSSEELASAVRKLAADPQTGADLGRRAQAVVRRNQGATDRTVARLAGLLSGVPLTREGGSNR